MLTREYTVRLSGRDMTIEDVIAVARLHARVEIDPQTEEIIISFRRGLEAYMKDNAVYGVNTGCGWRKDIALEDHQIEEYQRRYIPAHCCGVGEYLDEEIIRGAMVVRINSFLLGNSGMRWETIQAMVDFLNHDITPCVPRFGSVGASGDLIPLAHITSCLTGHPEAMVFYQGNEVPAKEAIEKCGLQPLVLQAKEAMGMTNGCSVTVAMAALATHDARNYLFLSNLVSALSLEAIRGEKGAFDHRIHKARSFKGQIEVAQQVLDLTEGSERMDEEAQWVDFDAEANKGDQKGPRVQDAYSFRSIPQVHGAVYDAIEHLAKLVKTEINSATDNPLVFKKEKDEKDEKDEYETRSGANFHGQPLAIALDALAIALVALANISDRRIYALLDPKRSYGLPADLSGPHASNTGLMIAQYMTVSVLARMKVLASPATLHSSPTSTGQEDHVSMATTAADKLRESLDLLPYILGTEALNAVQGIILGNRELPVELQKLGIGTNAAFEVLAPLIIDQLNLDSEEDFAPDRFLHKDILAFTDQITNGHLIDKVNQALGS